jgi:hypothetical protein
MHVAAVDFDGRYITYRVSNKLREPLAD